MVEQLYVAQYVPCSTQGIHPKLSKIYYFYFVNHDLNSFFLFLYKINIARVVQWLEH